MENTKKTYETKLNEIQGFVDSSRTGLGGVFVKKTQLNQHFDELQAIVKEQMEASNDILARKESLIQEGEAEAQKIIEKTRREILNQDMVMEANEYANNLVIETRREAAEHLKESKEQSETMLIHAHEYLENVFTDMEIKVDQHIESLIDQLSAIKSVIAENRNEIRYSLQQRMESLDKATEKLTS